jgi:hypothetical protein
MAESNGYTPTEKEILEKLKKGACTRQQLLLSLCYDLGDWNALKFHIVSLRKKLMLRGETIVSFRKDGHNYYKRISIRLA